MARAFRVSERQFVADEPDFLLVKRTVPVHRRIDVPVTAADVLCPMGFHARRRVVGVARRLCVFRQVATERESDGLANAVVAQRVVGSHIVLMALLQVGISEEDVQRVARDGTVNQLDDGRR